MLQGTLDVFSLDEVLGLLSGASKSGVLNINGDRGVGAISIADGQLVGGSASSAPEVSDIAEVVFELLRFREGSFSFDGEAVTDGDPHELDAVMESAHSRLSEWNGIEAVVPSLDHHLSLVENLSTSQVTLNESEWSAIVAIGEGATVGVVAHRLELGEFDGSKRVKGLIERALASLEAVAPAVEPMVTEPMVTEPMVTEAISADQPAVSAFIFETPEPTAVSLDSWPVAEMPDELSFEPIETVSDDDNGAEDIPPMPDAPDFEVAGFGATDVDDVPPMPEPPRPFGDEASLADELAPPITAENVEPVDVGHQSAGLDPIGSTDMFEPPLRADERAGDGFAIADTPPPAPGDVEIPSFAPPVFDADAFGVNDTDDVPSAEGSAFAAEGSAFAAEGSAFAADAADDDSSQDIAPPAPEGEAPEKSGSLLMRYLKSNG